MTSKDGFETLAIHAGQEPDPVTGAVVPPIYQVSTFKQDGVGGLRGGYEYSRSANPTRTALEQCLAALEAGSAALAFASGLAAEDCLIRTVCSPGDHVLVPDDCIRRDVPAVRPRVRRLGREPRRSPDLGRRGRARAARRADGPDGLGRDADEPAAEHRRYPCPGRRGARGRSAARGGQHVRLALPAAAAHAGGRRGGALDDQIPGGTFRRGGRGPDPSSTTSSPSGSPSPRTPPAVSPARSTRG